MEQQKIIEERVLAESDSVVKELRDKCPKLRLKVEQFTISSEEFGRLLKLEVVKDFFKMRSAMEHHKKILLKDIVPQIRYVIEFIYNIAININYRNKNSINSPGASIGGVLESTYKSHNIPAEIINIYKKLNEFELVFDIYDFDSLAKTMDKINIIYLEVLRIWSKIVIIPIKHCVSTFNSVFISIIVESKISSRDYKLISDDPGYLTRKFLENTNLVGDGFGISVIHLDVELRPGCPDRIAIELDKLQIDYLHLFYQLNGVMDGLLGNKFNNYSEFDRVLDVLEAIVGALCKFFFEGSLDLSDRAVCLRTTGFLMGISKVLISAIDVRYYCNSRIIEIGKLATHCCVGFINKLAKNSESGLDSSMKEVHNFVLDVIGFRRELHKCDDYYNKEFLDAMDSFESKCKDIKLSFDSVGKSELQTI